MKISSNFWNGVPVEKMDQWQATFDRQQNMCVMAPCPVCGEMKLRQYYHLEKREIKELQGRPFIGRGSFWAWCANCGAYEHASSLVPADWNGVTLHVDHAALTPLPTELEYAVLALLQNK